MAADDRDVRGRHRPPRAVAVSSSASATPANHQGPTLTHLAHFGRGLGSGSTIGPDGALYVTDGTAGSVKRVDRRTGAVSVYATGLPPRVLGIGGAIDVAFLAGRGYALVTMVGGDFVGGPHIGDAVVGIYRLDRGGHPSPIADIGAWSVAHPPKSGFCLTTGVQYAIRAVPRWVPRHRRAPQPGAPGHPRRRDHRGRDLRQTWFPTGLEVQGSRVWVTQAGPVPHVAETGQVLALDRRSEPQVVARGARLRRRRGARTTAPAVRPVTGQWDGVAGGLPGSSEHRDDSSA